MIFDVIDYLKELKESFGNQSEIKKLDFCKLKDLQKATVLGIQYADVWEYSQKEAINLYVSRHYLASSLITLYSFEIFLKVIIVSWKKPLNIPFIDGLYLSGLIKEAKTLTQFSKLHKELDEINTCRNNYLVHSKHKKGMNLSKSKYIGVNIYPFTQDLKEQAEIELDKKLFNDINRYKYGGFNRPLISNWMHKAENQNFKKISYHLLKDISTIQQCIKSELRVSPLV
ncbi:MAG: hypothetical protein NTY48_04365 [Candidatus Diapherotrites archaeon]|nr:hypothetical protein [Candidatus Diapherotrites archaeon]